MACGLGAVVLVFMLVKHDVANRDVVETDLLAADLAGLRSTEADLTQRLADARAEAAAQAARINAVSANLDQTQSGLAARREALRQEQAKISALEDSIKNTKIAQPEDVIETPGQGEENYIIGLKVEGRRIVVLLDSSSSMTDETLIEVIKRKNASDAVKRQGPKWRRSLDIVTWLMARAPKTSSVAVLAFGETAQTIAPGAVSGGDEAALKALVKSVQGIVPSGPTNLQAGLQEAVKMNPTDLYVITDGLPTTGVSRYQGLNPFSDCSSLIGRANTISGECRVKLFRHSIRNSGLSAGVKVNVIMLPIEGDPQAAPEFWTWTAVTGGLLIAPAENWP